jgi:hypothetical protein
MEKTTPEEKKREITQRLFDEVSDHLTWTECESAVDIFYEDNPLRSENKELKEECKTCDRIMEGNGFCPYCDTQVNSR